MNRSAPAPKTGPQSGWWDTANNFFLISNLVGGSPARLARVKRNEDSEARYRPFPEGARDQGTSVNPPETHPMLERSTTMLGPAALHSVWNAEAEKLCSEARKTHRQVWEWAWPVQEFNSLAQSTLGADWARPERMREQENRFEPPPPRSRGAS